jgi:hypothetical protein
MDYPLYQMTATLDNGMTFTVMFGPAPGLPVDIEDALAAAAGRAIRDFDWSALPVSPPATSATVAITRLNITDTQVPL